MKKNQNNQTEQVGQVKQVEQVEQVNQVKQVEQVEQVKQVEQVEQVNQVEQVEQVGQTTFVWRGPALYKIVIVTEDGEELIVQFDHGGLLITQDPRIDRALEQYCEGDTQNSYYKANIERVSP